MTNFRYVLILILLLPLSGEAEAQKVRHDLTGFSGFVKYLEKKYNITDDEIVITDEDSVIFHQVKNQENTGKNYLIGSCSKSFTALAINMLADEGRLDISRPVRDYLPWFRLSDSVRSSAITVRNLLNHTGGIPSRYGFFDNNTDNPSIFRKRLLDHLAEIEQVSEPGEKFIYCNLNYLLLGMIAEAVTGLKYPEILKQKVFTRIGMKNSGSSYNYGQLSRNIQPYQYSFFNIPGRSEFYEHSDLSVSFGNVSSNVADLAEYLRFMIRGGINSSGDTLVSNSSYSSLITPAKEVYCMGWTRFRYDSIDMVLHTGLDENYSAIIAFYPEMKVGIAVLCNINSIEFCSLVQAASVDVLTGRKPVPVGSFELKLRWGMYSMAVIMILLLSWNLFRWRKYSVRTGIILRIVPILRFVAGLVICTLPLIGIELVFKIPFRAAIDFEPDIIWSAIIILIAGLLSSVVRYFGTFSKMAKIGTGREQQIVK